MTQPKGNTAEMLTDMVLKLNGLTYQSLSKTNFQAAYTDAVSMMKDGHVQVFTLGTTAPASAVMDLASARDVKLVPVDDKTMDALKKANPGYNKLIIKAGTYPKQDKDVPVIGYSTHLVVACDLPENTVYKMAKAMAAQRRRHGRGGEVDRRAHAQGHGARHRRAVPQGRGEVLQGSRRDVMPRASGRGDERPVRTADEQPPTAPQEARRTALRWWRSIARRDVALPHVRGRLRPARRR